MIPCRGCSPCGCGRELLDHTYLTKTHKTVRVTSNIEEHQADIRRMPAGLQLASRISPASAMANRRGQRASRLPAKAFNAETRLIIPLDLVALPTARSRQESYNRLLWKA